MRIKSGQRGSSGTENPNGRNQRYHTGTPVPFSREREQHGPVSPPDPFRTLLDELSSGKPAPAGGSAAAAVVALTGALLEKVARLSARHWDQAAEAGSRAAALRRRGEELIVEDERAYLDYVVARREKKDVHGAWSRTIDMPLETVRAAVAVIELAHDLERHGNPNLRADAATAAMLAHSAITAAAMLIQVNLGVAPKDPRLDEALRLMRSASESVCRLGGEVGARHHIPKSP